MGGEKANRNDLDDAPLRISKMAYRPPRVKKQRGVGEIKEKRPTAFTLVTRLSNGVRIDLEIKG